MKQIFLIFFSTSLTLGLITSCGEENLGSSSALKLYGESLDLSDEIKSSGIVINSGEPMSLELGQQTEGSVSYSTSSSLRAKSLSVTIDALDQSGSIVEQVLVDGTSEISSGNGLINYSLDIPTMSPSFSGALRISVMANNEVIATKNINLEVKPEFTMKIMGVENGACYYDRTGNVDFTSHPAGLKFKIENYHQDRHIFHSPTNAFCRHQRINKMNQNDPNEPEPGMAGFDGTTPGVYNNNDISITPDLGQGACSVYCHELSSRGSVVFRFNR